jgi:hypothetical protein
MILQLTASGALHEFLPHPQGYACLVEGDRLRWKWVWTA